VMGPAPEPPVDGVRRRPQIRRGQFRSGVHGAEVLYVDDLILTRDLTRQGLDPNEVAQLTAGGDLLRVRRGAYVRPDRQAPTAGPSRPDEHERLDQQHRQLIIGTIAQLHPRAVVSHGSAAVLHGLPVFPGAIDLAHISRDRSGGGVRRSFVHVHGSPLSDLDVTQIDGVAVTSLARTVADLARSLPLDQAVAVGDRALRMGLDPAELADVLDRATRWVGVRKARRVAAFIDPRSESVGESFSRVRCHEVGLPAPELQFDVFNDLDEFVARTDFAWPELRTVGEFDGMVKYQRLLRKDETVEDAVIREKLREDALRDLGWQVARWIWAELFHSRIIADRLNRAFARSRR
jgi:hypothetical protein